MTLEEFLDGYVVMKNLSGYDWNFWEKENGDNIISYFVEAENKIEMTILKVRSHNTIILIKFLFPAINTVSTGREYENAIKWIKNHRENKHTYREKIIKGKYGKNSSDFTIGVNGFDQLKECLDFIFKENEK